VIIKHGTHHVPLEVLNNTEEPLRISRNTVVAELQQITIPEADPTAVPDLLRQCGVHANDNLTSDQLREVQEMINSYVDVFSVSDLDLGHTDLVKHRIELSDPVPFKERPRRIPPAMMPEVRSMCRRWSTVVSSENLSAPGYLM
jgi:hypothetical protein